MDKCFGTLDDPGVVIIKHRSPNDDMDVDEGYQKKITSFFIPPETGEYKFFSSCSKQCSVYLSDTREVSNKNLIISQKKPVRPNIFEK